MKQDTFEKLLKNSSDFIYIELLNGYFISTNKAFEEKVGRNEKDLKNTLFLDLIHPDDVESTKDVISKISNGDFPIKLNNRILTSNGTYRHLYWDATFDSETSIISAIARDASLELNSEEKLSESENKFHLFFENSQILMCTHDLNGHLININTIGANILACPADEITNYNVKDFLPTKFHKTFNEYLELMPTIKNYSGEMPTIDKNGKLHILLFRNVLVENNNEKFIIGNAIDFTDQYFLQNDLNKSRERLEQTNNLAKVGAWEYNVAKNKLYWSDIAKLIHEVPIDYVPTIEKNNNFYKGEHFELMKSTIEKALTEGLSYDTEVQIVTEAGNKKWIRVQGNSEMVDGNCIRLYGAYQDIHDRKTVELEIQKSRKLFDDVLKSAVEVSIIATDTNGLITLFNSGAEELLGYTSAEVVGKQHLEIFHDKDEILKRSNHLSKKYKKVISGIDVFTYNARITGSEQLEWTYIQKNKNQILASVVVSPIFDVGNKIIGYLSIAKDITDERRKLKELVESKKNAELANLAKSDFLANMSHEIRTPLNGIIGFTDLVFKTNLDETQKQYLSIVNQSASSLLGVINDILDFSKIEAGKLDINIERSDLHDIASQSIDIVTYQALSKGLEVLLNIPINLPKFIYTDNVRLKQILVNLLSNAVKFTSKGEIELNVTVLEKISEDEMLIRFQVKDSGIGIHENKLDKIFEAFTQEDSSTTKKFGGTGLGLTIANKLLVLMDSRLNLVSKLEKGSTFYFDLKLKIEHNDTPILENSTNLKSVLIVDDNKNNRSILKGMLQINNIETTEAKSGAEALTLLSKKGNTYDVIIVDFDMPEMDGIETIKRIRENTDKNLPMQPILLLHGSNDFERIIKECENYKVCTRLIKPIRINDLYDAFKQIKKNREGQIEMSDSVSIASTEQSKILIVDDNVINMLLTKTLVKLSMPNAIVLEAKNGLEAIEQFKKEQPEIIFMDIQMSNMNGYTATKKIRKLEKGIHTPIIALTAGNIKGEREKSLENGMDDFLTKPVTFNALSECLSRWITTENNVEENNIDKKHIKIETLKDIIGNNESLALELMEQSKSELQNYKAELSNQLTHLNKKKYKSIAHKLYGMSSAFGMEILSETSKEIESTDLSNKEVTTKIKLLINEIDVLLEMI